MIKNIILAGLTVFVLSGCMAMTVGKVVGAGFVAAVPQQGLVHTDTNTYVIKGEESEDNDE